MKSIRWTRLLYVAVCTVLTWWASDVAVAQSTWKAGVGKVQITPEQSMSMAGYGSRTHPSEGKYGDIWAKALVLDDGQDHRALLVSLDLVGIDRTLSQAVCRQLKERFGFERSQIALCMSHTHSGPVVGHCLDPLHYRLLDAAQQALIDQYAETLQSRIVRCVAKALENVEPCTLSWGSSVATFAVNRRNNPAAAVPRLRAENKLKGPSDHAVPVLAIRATDSQLMAVVFGYACHATVLSDYSWSGDYPGYAQLEVEAKHPGCVAMFWAGCGADQNPLPRRELKLAKQYGKQLAEAVEKTLSGNMPVVKGPLETKYREIALPLDTLPTEEELKKQAESDNKYMRARAKILLKGLAAGKPLAQVYPYPIGLWKFDDQIQFIFLGGEVVVDFALRLKSELSGTRTWVAGYSNDVMAYIPSLRVLREGGYEGATAMVYYGLPTSWAPQVETLIVQAVGEMAGQASKETRAAPAEKASR